MQMTVERFARKNLIALFITVVLLITFLVCVFAATTADVTNLLLESSPFDYYEAIQDVPLVSLFTSSTDSIDGIFTELIDSYAGIYDAEARHAILYNTKYSQGNRYIFNITPDAIYDIGLAYEIATTIGGSDIDRDPNPVYRYLLLEYYGAVFFAKVPFNSDVSTGDTLTGVFVPFDVPTIGDIKETFGDYEAIHNLFQYQLDTTLDLGFDMILAFIFSLVCIALIAWLAYILITQLFIKEKQPIYKKMHLLNADINIINKQLKTAEKIGKNYYTEEWIIIPRLLRTGLTRNGM